MCRRADVDSTREADDPRLAVNSLPERGRTGKICTCVRAAAWAFMVLYGSHHGTATDQPGYPESKTRGAEPCSGRISVARDDERQQSSDRRLPTALPIGAGRRSGEPAGEHRGAVSG